MEGKRLPCGMISALRQFLLGRVAPENHRYSCELATRSPELPCIAPGPHFRLCDVEYYKRDARRDMRAPQLQPLVTKIAQAYNKCGDPLPKAPTPNCVYNWDDHETTYTIGCKTISNVRKPMVCGLRSQELERRRGGP